MLAIAGVVWSAATSPGTETAGTSATPILEPGNGGIVHGDSLTRADLLPSDDAFILRARVRSEQQLVDGIREQSYGRVDLPVRGEGALARMSDAQFEDYTYELIEMLREVQEENTLAAEAFLADLRQAWPRQECPANGPVDRALFGETLLDAIGLDSFDAVPGFELTHVADISLPDGVVHLNTASFDDSWTVDLRAPGVHPFYMASAIWEGEYEYVSFAQLVVAPGDPVRWVEDDRFGLEAEYSQLWIGGADALVETNFDTSDHIELIAYDMYTQELIANRESPCEHWAHADGHNVVRQDASFDGSFPAYAGYDASGRLLAVTWDFGESYREEQATPGIEQPTPTPAPSDSVGPQRNTDL